MDSGSDNRRINRADKYGKNVGRYSKYNFAE